jgi:L-fuconolactonase
VYPIIDTHTHFYDPARPQGVPWPGRDDKLLYRTVLPDDCQKLARPEGVTGTVVVEASSWLEDNQWILDLAAHDEFLLGLVGNLALRRAEFAAELARFVRYPHFCGIRCGGRTFTQIDAPLLRDLALLARSDRQLDVLIGPEQWDGVLTVAAQLPALRIVIDHIGSMPVTGAALDPQWLERYQRAAAQPNIFMKVSGLLENSVIRPAPATLDFYRPTLDALWATFGPDRLIYGSNWPVCEVAGTYATCIDLVRSYFGKKGPVAAERFFWQNALQVYRYDRR